jgi:hypothetical protein
MMDDVGGVTGVVVTDMVVIKDQDRIATKKKFYVTWCMPLFGLVGE